MTKIFVAYPAVPAQVGDTIEAASRQVKTDKPSLKIGTWKRPDLSGYELIQPIINAIGEADFIAGDVTCPNFNVAYELGYALGLGKRVLPLVNSSIQFDSRIYQQIGIFDNLLRETYSNSSNLIDLFAAASAGQRIATDYPLDASPLYIVLPRIKIDEYATLRTRARRVGLPSRAFDPPEHGTLSATEAIKQVAVSRGVIAPLLAPDFSDAIGHNLRVGFVAGVAHALLKPTLLLKKGDWPAPADISGRVTPFVLESTLQNEFSQFAALVFDDMHATPPAKKAAARKGLATLNLGDPAAEYEEQGLEEYFLERDEYRQVVDGRANIVVGRKGSGKTAVWVRSRDQLKGDKSRIVLALSPEGFQLKKLKDIVLSFLTAGSREFLLSAFWEYVLMMEICAEILNRDQELHKMNHNLFEPYQRLLKFFKSDDANSGLDFSDRLSRVIDQLSEQYQLRFGNKENVKLSNNELTNILYKTTLSEMRSEIEAYLAKKSGVCVLFDNIDKGWNANGLQQADVIMIRTLIDAGRKLRNDFGRRGISFAFSAFLRNDVYDILLSATPDRGKDTKVLVDWIDRDLLKQVIRKRMISNPGFDSGNIEALWHRICVPIVDGRNSLDYLIDRSLMRPRYLLRSISHCLGNAINFGRDRIDDADIDKGISVYSSEIVTEIDHEINDVVGFTSGILYIFLGEKQILKKSEVMDILRAFLGEKDLDDEIFRLFLWHGVLGLQRSAQDVAFIFDLNYDLRRLEGLIQKAADGNPFLQINPAFWAGLELTP